MWKSCKANWLCVWGLLLIAWPCPAKSDDASSPRMAAIHQLGADQRPPAIDGKLHDAVWQQLNPLAAFVRSAKSPDLSHLDIWFQTRAWACWDDKHLYVAFMCREWLMRKVREPAAGRDDPQLLAGDWVELRIAPGSEPAPAFRFVVDPANHQWDAKQSDERDIDVAWNGAWRSATSKRNAIWVAELAIPWSDIGGKPEEMCRVNLIRNRLPRRHMLMSWSRVAGEEDVAELAAQGSWRFEGPLVLPADAFAGDGHRQRDLKQVIEVMAGQRDDANAAWWGFDPADSTRFLQAAIDSGARRVIVPNMGSDWVITPVVLASNQQIVFEPGVVITAKPGAFHNKNTGLFRGIDLSDLTLTGYGATLRMQKQDYMSDAYVRSQHRHCLDFESCRNLVVEGLTIKDSGGDGILLSSWGRGYNENVIIRDVVCDNNYRQGISVISAQGLLIENCLFKNTTGTGPSAGIDLEPDEVWERMADVVIRNCVAENNDGTGFTLTSTTLSSESRDVSIRFENCLVRGGKRYGFNVSGPTDTGPNVDIEFNNCHVENVDGIGVRILDKSAERGSVRFVGCTWKSVAAPGIDSGDYRHVPILLHLREKRFAKIPGGVEFVDCLVVDNQDRPVIAFGTPVADPPAVRGVRGNITVKNPHGARADLGSEDAAADLRFNE